MTEKTVKELQAHIRGRIALLEQQRDNLVTQANAQLAGLNFTIGELQGLIGEGPKPEEELENAEEEPDDGPPKE